MSCLPDVKTVPASMDLDCDAIGLKDLRLPRSEDSLTVVQNRTANCLERVYRVAIRREREPFAGMQGWARRFPSSRRSPQLNPGKRASIPSRARRGTLAVISRRPSGAEIRA